MLRTTLTGKAKVEISRFKGLGEMPMRDLKDTTMDKSKRALLKVQIVPEEIEGTADAVERLMGNRPEARFAFIQQRAPAAADLVDI